MLCLNKEELSKDIDLEELKKYMLYAIKDNIVKEDFKEEIKEDFKEDFKEDTKTLPNNVPRSQLQINYTKNCQSKKSVFKIINYHAIKLSNYVEYHRILSKS